LLFVALLPFFAAMSTMKLTAAAAAALLRLLLLLLCRLLLFEQLFTKNNLATATVKAFS